MTRRRRSSGALAGGLALAALVSGLLSPASASPAGALVVGGALTGTVSPPLDTTPRLNSQTLDEIILQYAGAIGSRPAEGIGFCTGAATSGAPETVVAGSGTGSLGCSTMDDLNGWGTMACSFAYQRSGGAYLVPGITCAFKGLAPGTLTGNCVFAWEPSGVPARTFMLQGSCSLR